jgi:hypothetical protein
MLVDAWVSLYALNQGILVLPDSLQCLHTSAPTPSAVCTLTSTSSCLLGREPTTDHIDRMRLLACSKYYCTCCFEKDLARTRGFPLPPRRRLRYASVHDHQYAVLTESHTCCCVKLRNVKGRGGLIVVLSYPHLAFLLDLCSSCTVPVPSQSSRALAAGLAAVDRVTGT